MANVLQSPIEFQPRPVNHAPSPFGFGFGLGSPASVVAGWQTAVTPGHTNPAAFQQLASTFNQISPPRVLKRRHEPEDDIEFGRHTGVREDAMDRSPTPERPKRAAPKRARIATSVDADSKDGKTSKENKASAGGDDHDVDVGVLLASLPPQSLLSILTSLLNAQPSLKATILPLIPRPTLETAIQALALSAKKLRDAYPYSNIHSPSFSQPSSAPSFGLGSGFGSNRSNTFIVANAARQSLSHNQSVFGPNSNSHQSHGGMRESYILSRLRPHITEFVAACMSYLPYFSYMPMTTSHSNSTSHTSCQLPSLQSLHKDKFHPSETYVFLSALTNHIASQPPLTQSSLTPLLLPRLSEEWKAWVDRVDEVVNRQGGMFGRETVGGWERGLDDFAEMKGFEGGEVMRDVRDRWVAKVGWLVGRTAQQPMEEH